MENVESTALQRMSIQAGYQSMALESDERFKNKKSLFGRDKGILHRLISYIKNKRNQLQVQRDYTNKEKVLNESLVLMDMRSRFLQGVKEEYGEWLDSGYINARDLFDLQNASDQVLFIYLELFKFEKGNGSLK